MLTTTSAKPVVYWRLELPPRTEDFESEHEVTATSVKVHAPWDMRGKVWGQCYESLMDNARARIVQEVERLGGSCAHVTDEVVTKRDDAAEGNSWLAGRFRFVMYVHPVQK